VVTKVGLYKDPRKKHPWVVRWYGEHDPATGKQRRYSQAFRLKADAEYYRGFALTAWKQAREDQGRKPVGRRQDVGHARAGLPRRRGHLAGGMRAGENSTR